MFTHLPRHTYAMALGYLQLPIQEFAVAVPYWVNRLATLETPAITGYLGGKGTPAEIKEYTEKLLDQQPKIKNELTSSSLIRFMGKHMIGVDCSGLAFQMLTAFTYDMQNRSVDELISTNVIDKPKNHARFRTNANTLTNDQNTIEIPTVSQIKIGDLIRMEGGKHVCFIITVTPEKITYLHSSRSAIVQQSGAHLGEITISNPGDNLSSQTWHERTRKGDNFGTKFFDPSKGDSIRRAKWLTK